MSPKLSNKDIITDMIKNGASQEEALKLYDKLEPIDVNFMIGKWHGKEIKTGHPMDGLLDASHWWGKEFKSINEGFPLIFELGQGHFFYGNPIKILKKRRINMSRKLVKIIFPLLYLYIKTNKSKSQLRPIKYRNQVSASMVYDEVPVIDNFRKVDQDTVMGAMDSKFDEDERTYFFVLFRK